jgi:hypothetical protein
MAPQRGGRAKRVVRVTPQGMLAAKEFYKAIMRVSRDASWRWMGGGARRFRYHGLMTIPDVCRFSAASRVLTIGVRRL